MATYNTYTVGGLTVASAATANHGVCMLWNPSGSKRLTVMAFGIVAVAAPGAGSGIRVVRATARGTAGSTVTPDADNRGDGTVAPQTGAVLDLATYTGQPTIASPALEAWVLAAVIGSGVILPLNNGQGYDILPGTGLAIVNRAAIAVPACEVFFTWEE